MDVDSLPLRLCGCCVVLTPGVQRSKSSLHFSKCLSVFDLGKINTGLTEWPPDCSGWVAQCGSCNEGNEWVRVDLVTLGLWKCLGLFYSFN